MFHVEQLTTMSKTRLEPTFKKELHAPEHLPRALAISLLDTITYANNIAENLERVETSTDSDKEYRQEAFLASLLLRLNDWLVQLNNRQLNYFDTASQSIKEYKKLPPDTFLSCVVETSDATYLYFVENSIPLSVPMAPDKIQFTIGYQQKIKPANEEAVSIAHRYIALRSAAVLDPELNTTLEQFKPLPGSSPLISSQIIQQFLGAVAEHFIQR